MWQLLALRIVALMESRGDAQRQRDGLVELANKAASRAASIDALVRAAELDETASAAEPRAVGDAASTQTETIRSRIFLSELCWRGLAN